MFLSPRWDGWYLFSRCVTLCWVGECVVWLCLAWLFVFTFNMFTLTLYMIHLTTTSRFVFARHSEFLTIKSKPWYQSAIRIFWVKGVFSGTATNLDDLLSFWRGVIEYSAAEEHEYMIRNYWGVQTSGLGSLFFISYRVISYQHSMHSGLVKRSLLLWC